MLVFRRRLLETVVITVPPSTVPQEVRVTVVGSGMKAAKLGIVTAPDVRVDREEIHNERKAS